MSDSAEFPPPELAVGPQEDSVLKQKRRLVRISALTAIVVGAFLPWASISAPFIGSINKNGIDGDGAVTLVLAGIGIIANLRQSANSTLRSHHTTTAVIGVICGGIAVVDMVDVSRLADDTDLAVVQIGIGLWVTLASALVALGSSVGSGTWRFGERRIDYRSSAPGGRVLKRDSGERDR